MRTSFYSVGYVTYTTWVDFSHPLPATDSFNPAVNMQQSTDSQPLQAFIYESRILALENELANFNLNDTLVEEEVQQILLPSHIPYEIKLTEIKWNNWLCCACGSSEFARKVMVHPLIFGSITDHLIMLRGVYQQWLNLHPPCNHTDGYGYNAESKLLSGNLFAESYRKSSVASHSELSESMEYHAHKVFTVSFDSFFYFASEEEIYQTMFACVASNTLCKYIDETVLVETTTTQNRFELPVDYKLCDGSSLQVRNFMLNLLTLIKRLNLLVNGTIDMMVNSHGEYGVDLCVSLPGSQCEVFATNYASVSTGQFSGTTVLVNPFPHAIPFELASTFRPVTRELNAHSFMVISGDCPYRECSNLTGVVRMYCKAFIPPTQFRSNPEQYDAQNQFLTYFPARGIPLSYAHNDVVPDQLTRYQCKSMLCTNPGLHSYPWCDSCLTKCFSVVRRLSEADGQFGLFATKIFKLDEVIFTESLVNNYFELFDDTAMKRRYPFIDTRNNNQLLFRLVVDNDVLYWDQSRCRGVVSCAGISGVESECNCAAVMEVTDNQVMLKCVATAEIGIDVELVVFCSNLL